MQLDEDGDLLLQRRPWELIAGDTEEAGAEGDDRVLSEVRAQLVQGAWGCSASYVAQPAPAPPSSRP